MHVRSAVDAIGPATDQAEAWLSGHEASAGTTYLVALAIEELITNCIKYGYDDAAEHFVDIVFSVRDGALSMEVIDDGHAFNPLEAPPPDLSLAMEDRPIGGLGIHLLRELADGLTYERRNGTNRVVIRKRMT